MEQPKFESGLNVDPAWIPIYQAIDAMAQKYDDVQRRKFLANELRRRAEGHDIKDQNFGQQFYTWKKSQEQNPENYI